MKSLGSHLIKGGLNRKRLVFVAGFAIIAASLLIVSRAATPTTHFEAENSVLSSGAVTGTNAQSSNGQFVQFIQTPTPSPAPPPPVSGWPSAANSGLLVSTTRTMGGADIDTSSWFGSNGFSGNGTEANPYVVDRVRFTGMVTIGAWDAADTDLEGKVVKFTNCRFEGNPGNPTPGGSSFIRTRPSSVDRVIVEDSTLGPNTNLVSTGGPNPAVGGVDIGVYTTKLLTLNRNNIYGAAIAVMIGGNDVAGTSTMQDNFMHDTWSASGDHTDIINGNPSASHVVVRHNYLDGIRTGNTYVTNCFGIYDDAGTISDWTIDNNYIDRCATGILATTSTSRFANPFIVTNNVFGRMSLTRFSARAPSQQSGNTDVNGNPITL